MYSALLRLRVRAQRQTESIEVGVMCAFTEGDGANGAHKGVLCLGNLPVQIGDAPSPWVS